MRCPLLELKTGDVIKCDLYAFVDKRSGHESKWFIINRGDHRYFKRPLKDVVLTIVEPFNPGEGYNLMTLEMGYVAFWVGNSKSVELVSRLSV